jgi:hypothetical protein
MPIPLSAPSQKRGKRLDATRQGVDGRHKAGHDGGMAPDARRRQQRLRGGPYAVSFSIHEK